MNNLPPNLPALKAGWSWVKLGDVCKVKGGFAFKSKDYQKDGIPLVRISNIEVKSISLEECVYIKPDNESKLKEFLLHKGDILIALSGATTGKYGIYKHDKKAFLNQRIGRLHFNGSDKIIPSFVYLYLEIIRSEILKTAYGAAQPNISPSEIADFSIPLPPLPEQKKIVEKIEELFSGLDSGAASLKKAKEEVRLYRQSVLASAFSGKLVSDKVPIDDGGINNEELIRQLPDKNESGKNNSSLFITNYSLPKGWKWVKLGEVCDKIQDGSHFSPQKSYTQRADGRYLYITSKNIRNNYLDLDNVTYVDAEFHNSIFPRCNPEFGDVLLTKDGANTGNVTINTLSEEFSLLSSVCLIKPNKGRISSQFIKYYLQSPLGFKEVTGAMTGTAIKRIILKNVKIAKIILPPLSQQLQIVSEIEKRFSEADNLEKAIDDSLAKSELLRQSILSKAFSGKLV